MTTLVEELEQAANDLAGMAHDHESTCLRLAARLRARAARVREVLASGPEDETDRFKAGWNTAMRLLAGPDLGPTRRDGGT